MPKIIILRGLQGSGKTTWAKKWCEEDPARRVRFNRDDIRNMLGPYWVPKREDFVTHLYFNFLSMAMLEQLDIVIDNMNLNEKCIAEIEEEVAGYNEWTKNESHISPYEIEVMDEFLLVPLEACIQRDSQRPSPIGASVIRSTYNKYKDKIAPWKYLN